MQILNENLIYLQKGTKGAAEPDNNKSKLWNKLTKNYGCGKQQAKPDLTNLKTMKPVA